MEKQKTNNSGQSVAEMRRREAKEKKYLKASRSFRVWPITVEQDEQVEQCIRRFFIINMKTPAALAKDVEIEAVRMPFQAMQDPGSMTSISLLSKKSRQETS